MRDVVVFREPKLKPLPIAVQDKMKDAPLMLRLQTAKKAIEACYDLSELLKWKDQAAAIAAAAKAAKMPDIAKGANRICKEALLRLGQLLNQYNGDPGFSRRADGRIVRSVPSERGLAARTAGVTRHDATTASRFALAPKSVVKQVLEEDRIPAAAGAIARQLPRTRNARHAKYPNKGATYHHVMNGQNAFGGRDGVGLTYVLNSLGKVRLSEIKTMPPDEKKLVKAKVAEIMDLLDAIDEACK